MEALRKKVSNVRLVPGGLTPKQEAFCHNYLMTGNASEAYRRVYECNGSSAKTIWEEACALRKNPTVAPRIAELAEEYIKPINVTPEWIEERLSIEALKAQSDGARASNLKTLGQVHAMLTMKNRDTSHETSDDELILSIVGADMVNPPVSIKDLNEPDRKLYATLMAKMGH